MEGATIMIALCVDDEPLLLDALSYAVNQSPDITETADFKIASDAIHWAETHTAEIAFLDIRLRGTTGLELAKKLLELQPKMHIVFCTGYDDYARDAFRIHAAGYLTKPIDPAMVQGEIDHILGKDRSDTQKNKLMTVNCFGEFQVFVDGKPLILRRTKARELLAYLVDRRGAQVSARQICAVLWPDDMDEQKHMNYFYQLLSDLRSGLKRAGAEEVLLSSYNSYAVETSLLDCDFYRFLNGDEDAKKLFTGEYMNLYSWAEETCAYLSSVMLSRP